MMNDLLKDDLEAMENAMCKLAPRADIWQDRLLWHMCKAIRDLLILAIRKEKCNAQDR